jgi:hypothetical protein
MMLTVPIPAQATQPSVPPKRRSRAWLWAALIGGTIIVNAATLRRDTNPRAEVNGQPPEPVVVAAIEPEIKGQAAPPVVVAEAEAKPEPQEPVEVAPDQPTPAAPPAPASTTPPLTGLPALLKAADEGDPEAMYTLAGCYEDGEEVEQDAEKAAAWYEEAAKAGHRDAMYTIATLYERGEGVDQDYEKAAEWYEKAAEAGDAVAMRTIGLFYAVGKGVQQDKQLAVQWLKKSADAGYEDAKPSIGLALVGVPPAMAAVMMSKAIGGKYAETHKPAPVPDDTKELPPSYETPAERVQRRIAMTQGILSGRVGLITRPIPPAVAEAERERMVRVQKMQFYARQKAVRDSIEKR